jgi:SAM-dependent methyltransferase
MVTMRQFVEANGLRDGKTIVDIGSLNINGSYRDLFSTSKYIGVDLIHGNNVDIIIDSDEWHGLKDVDAVISGQTFEHVADIPKLLSQIKEILKPGGLLCVIAPSEGAAHEYPIWRGNFTVDEMTRLVVDAGFIVDSCTITTAPPWFDCVCIAHKGIECEQEI